MTIKVKLILATIFEILLVVLLSVSLLVSSQQIDKITGKEMQATSIVETISQIRFVTFENLLNQNERSFEQWQIKHASLQSLLRPRPSHNPEEAKLLADITSLSKEANTIFNRLTDSYNEPKSNQEADTHVAFQERLATQLLIKQQTQISKALKLSTIARQDAAVLRQQANVLTGAVILIMFLITVVNFFFIAGGIAKALALFQQGAEKIAEGNFDYRIKSGKPGDELGRLAAAFNSMAASLEQIDKVKSDFILLASHQLRTPLTSVKWSSEALTSTSSQLSQEKKQHYIQQIHDSNERMIKLVNELLDVSKIGLGTISANPEQVSLDSVLKQVLDELSPMARHNKIHITHKTDNSEDTVLMDPAWVHIIFQNLLSNAIKYSTPGSVVRIALLQHEKDVLVSVKDHGCGIPADQQDKIFTKLFRAENAKQIVGEGSGLGLYIAKALVNKVGGEIWFESVENKGSTFYVKLPRSASKTV